LPQETKLYKGLLKVFEIEESELKTILEELKKESPELFRGIEKKSPKEQLVEIIKRIRELVERTRAERKKEYVDKLSKFVEALGKTLKSIGGVLKDPTRKLLSDIYKIGKELASELYKEYIKPRVKEVTRRVITIPGLEYMFLALPVFFGGAIISIFSPDMAQLLYLFGIMILYMGMIMAIVSIMRQLWATIRGE